MSPLPLHMLSRDIADQGAWVGMPRARLEHWSSQLSSLDDTQKRLIAAQLIVLARGIRGALHERGTMAVLQLVTLVRMMLGEGANIGFMFDVTDERPAHLSLVGRPAPRRKTFDDGRRFFEMMTES